MVTIEVNGARELYAEIASISNAFDGMAVNAMEDYKDRVKEQTAQRKDFEGFRFAPYARSYAKRKKVNQGDVDLRSKYAGSHMMDFLAVQASGPGGAALTITDDKKAAIAGYHVEGTDRMPRRDFMSVGIRGENFIVDRIERLIQRLYKGLIS